MSNSAVFAILGAYFGSFQLRSAICVATLAQISHLADMWYDRIEQLSHKYGAWEIAPLLPAEARYLASANSIALDAVIDPNIVIAGLSREVKALLVETLGPFPVCDIDLAWVRRQYPESLRPPASATHSWHQDGALGFDFVAGDIVSPDALIPMVTLWIPLHSCGEYAPGLELINESLGQLLTIDRLKDEAIAKIWPDNKRIRPNLILGDVLFIMGDTVHRTFANDSMTKFRGCVELRFCPSKPIPKRLMADRMISLSNDC